MLTYHRTTESEKYEIAAWNYEGDYAIYNLTPYEEQKKKHSGLANEKNLFYSFYDDKTLVGFINLYEEETEVFFGIGVKPECCCKGYGQEMAKTARKLSAQLFPEKGLYLEVRTWNKRAVRCYEKSGFHIAGAPIVQTTGAGEWEFYRMEAEK